MTLFAAEKGDVHHITTCSPFQATGVLVSVILAGNGIVDGYS
ncbi:hypothetical protein [Xenorhabdus griffiniae]|uniref:Uncharacterized protein n=1 Tax=Xenorhabdus griffiniae TaxID=351672 RepID=A0ABY9XF99_9GAMM|nr:hypothetical protein [Xenorhabdus griffiniae]WMV71602.1 hypothetical protein QL128_15835 [Xenorhabdus griffiniae]WNH01279.1 hypothetical protein QL112_015840 [Xenorhabdus griffiniae]